MLNSYYISFDIDFNTIERVVKYNNNIFEFDDNIRIIYLKDNNSLNILANKYKVDNTINEIIEKF